MARDGVRGRQIGLLAPRLPGGLVPEEPLFGFEAAGKAREAPVMADDPVAWDDYTHRISTDRGAHGAAGSGSRYRTGNLPVGSGRPEWD